METVFRIALFLFFTLSISSSSNAQSKSQIRLESVLTSKKWVCLDVGKKKLTKMEFRFEVGNELSFSIDKKYAFKNNDYNYQSGTWKLDSKYLYFFYNASDGSNRILTSKYKLNKINESSLILKRTEKPKGKLVFK